ncbi:PPE family protein [Mycolicibacter arupensis]|jgi:PPE-repeat protein|uniref:PPE family protein n=1 Tax=Mycolicibacter arupensis TaxID=342002 RepID=A0A5C7Y260_9MYCO|nr:PPE family protein [Mycolicibacter arupensis]KAA1432962.1 PPE family protein [Mycolicibacter arupensis]TXI55860.1 MAG: PPE family protein [Mycolicibacter arupensis]
MDFGTLPPEINSALMYSGAGSAPLWAASRAWETLGAEIYATAASYTAVLTDLTAEWQGPAAAAMAKSFEPHLEWLNRAAAQAEQIAAQAGAAAAAHDAAFAATVPPAVVEANRETLMSLMATNVLGQNTPAIAATEAAYGEMWIQDAVTMYGYAGQSAAASQLTPFSAPAPTVNPAGVAAQEAAVAAAVGSAPATDADTLASLISSLPNQLGALAGPGATSLLEDLLNPITWNGSTITFNGLYGDLMRGLTGSATLSASSPFDAFIRMVSPVRLFSTAFKDIDGLSHSLLPATKAVEKVAEGAAKAAEGAAKSLGAGIAGTIGHASLVGPLSVPQTWAAALPAAAVHSAPVQLASYVGSAGAAAGEAGHSALGGMPMAGAGGGGRGGFGAFGTPRYGFRPMMVGRPPAGG